MSQTSKMILITAIIAAFIGGGGVYLWQNNGIQTLPLVSNQAPSNEWNELIQYNCELSGGSFNNNTCTCPLEGAQSQKKMYDKSTGYCQSTMGGPAGDAFAASVGLPWGDYSFWAEIIENNCTETGGDWLNARCTCSDGLTYNESTGYCE